jgi:dihydrofolate reductase
MILSSIVAMAKNRVIGKDNQLPWHIPEDLKYFKDKTKNAVLIMGRKTFESLPGLLKNRYTILITRNINATSKIVSEKAGVQCTLPESQHYLQTDFALVTSIHNAIEWAHQLTDSKGPYFRPEFSEEVYVCGGAEIYERTLTQIDRLYLTKINQDFEGDTFFPVFEDLNFKLMKEDKRSEPVEYSFLEYHRRQQS